MAQAEPSSKDSRFDMAWAYYAIVSVVSVLAVTIVGIDFLQDILAIVFPSLLDGEVAREVARHMTNPTPDFMSRAMPENLSQAEREAIVRASLRVTPRDIVNDIIILAVFGGLLVWHFPRMLRRK